MKITWSLAFLAMLASSAAAQMRYKDAEGVTHFVDSLSQVPPEFRASATGQPSAPAPPGPPAVDWDKRAKEAEEALERERAKSAPAPRPAMKQAQPAYDYAGFQLLVDSCAAKVRSSFDQRDNMNRVVAESRFSAAVNGPGNVNIIGSSRERFAFQRCMADEGVPVQ